VSLPVRLPKDKARASYSSAINKWIFAKKQPAAARNGYLIVRICLLDVLPTCGLYCDSAAVRLAKGTSLNASRYDACCQASAHEVGNWDSFAVPSAINWPASYREATLSLVKIHPAATTISGRRFSMASGSKFGTLNS
jgi:hypothetical protein